MGTECPSDRDRIHAYSPVVAALKDAFEKFRHQPAFANFGRTLTRGEIYELSLCFASISATS
jgi:long-chain acyl-CoA synthetase